MLNMVLKDMSNKTGYKVVPARQIKYNRRRRRRRRRGRKKPRPEAREASAESWGRRFKSHERPVRA